MTTPKTFFLNERQELSSFEREGGGPPAKYVRINWTQRSSTLANSFRRVTTSPVTSRDPMGARHHFVVAVPVDAVEKHSKSKKAALQQGIVRETPAFGGEQSKLFRKLGMDLIEVLPEGKASVHVANVNSVLATMESLPQASEREKARWITFDQFLSADWRTRVDEPWLSGLKNDVPVETWIRFQPTLSRSEAQELMQAITSLIGGQTTRLLKAGREFSGRYWCVGLLTRAQIELIAKEFGSVQSIHPRYATAIAASANPVISKPSTSISSSTANPTQLPTVAIVDTGIPEQHVTLAPYRRSGYRNPDIDPTIKSMGEHGSNVASCAVFGHIDGNQGSPVLPAARCRVMDVFVSYDNTQIDDEILIPAVEAIVGTAPDVRVFNLSFGGPPLDSLSVVRRREELIKIQDMDNLAFARDVVFVIAAGNTPAGVEPATPYPNHGDDPRWALGARARSFNGIVCGGYVDTVGNNTVAGIRGAPSPFTRVGPGLCDSPVPGFSAPAGDSLDTYQWAPGTGVGVVTPANLWEDHNGTSFAAPLVASEAAWACHELARHTGHNTIPFAGTVKAWLHLVATRPPLSGAHERLAKRSLGRGRPSAQRLLSPSPDSAVFVWQTVLQAPKTVARVRVPVPLDWLKRAIEPKLRVVAAWNGPVNMALADSWACRKVGMRVRPFGGEEALRGGGGTHGGYPLIDRTFDIHPDRLAEKNFTIGDELWVLEAEYEEIGEYPPAMTMSPQQRVGAVIELLDAAASPVSPQSYVQALPIAAELDRLSSVATPLMTPILIRT
jgi:hypothetical protein